MARGLDPERPIADEIALAVTRLLDDAVDRLDAMIAGTDVASGATVHRVRTRCKEVRGLVRLARPALGDDFGRFDRLVRDGARELAGLRDAYALLGAVDALGSRADAALLASVRAEQARHVDDADAALAAGDPRPARAREALTQARALVDDWQLGPVLDAVGPGLRHTYRSGRTAWKLAVADPSDDRLHRSRRHAKHLWYQVRALRRVAPGRLGPLAEQLDSLSKVLGDHHDLAVLIEALEGDPERFGGAAEVAAAVAVARARQQTLERRALRIGERVWGRSPRRFARTFARRIDRRWAAPVAAPVHREPPAGPQVIERERKFLVARPPDPATVERTVHVLQGYLAVTDDLSLRVRAASTEAGVTHTLTVKTGVPPVRVELDLPISAAQFAAAWPATEANRVDKVRSLVPYGDVTIEVDVFAGRLAGLVVAEVEFADADTMAAFTAPAWFGREVTHDRRYQNARLAAAEAPPSEPPNPSDG